MSIFFPTQHGMSFSDYLTTLIHSLRNNNFCALKMHNEKRSDLSLNLILKSLHFMRSRFMHSGRSRVIKFALIIAQSLRSHPSQENERKTPKNDSSRFKVKRWKTDISMISEGRVLSYATKISFSSTSKTLFFGATKWGYRRNLQRKLVQVIISVLFSMNFLSQKNRK